MNIYWTPLDFRHFLYHAPQKFSRLHPLLSSKVTLTFLGICRGTTPFLAPKSVFIIYLSITINLVPYKPHLSSHSFHGSGVWAQLSWVVCKATARSQPGSLIWSLHGEGSTSLLTRLLVVVSTLRVARLGADGSCHVDFLQHSSLLLQSEQDGERVSSQQRHHNFVLQTHTHVITYVPSPLPYSIG